MLEPGSVPARLAGYRGLAGTRSETWVWVIGHGMRPVHPGEVLGEELEELGLSASALDVPANRITAILNGQRGVSADTALRLSRYFGTTPQFWLNLQKTFELRVAQTASGREIAERVRPRALPQRA